MTLEEISRVGELVTAQMDEDANVIWGARVTEDMKGKLTVMTIITGVKSPWVLGKVDKRLDRQHLGRALLNDIGVCYAGPHGRFVHCEQAYRLIRKLHDFGYFAADNQTEFIPFWRSRGVIAYGEEPPAKSNDVYVSVYRRPLADGQGTKALIVIMNERFKPAAERLTIADAPRILGGPNTLKTRALRATVEMPDALQGWWQGLAGRDGDAPALMDFETGECVRGQDANAYGPVYVPYHDFRVLYAESRR